VVGTEPLAGRDLILDQPPILGGIDEPVAAARGSIDIPRHANLSHGHLQDLEPAAKLLRNDKHLASSLHKRTGLRLCRESEVSRRYTLNGLFDESLDCPQQADFILVHER
jgi:hypothetical protein